MTVIDGHPLDELSALLDGELTPEEERTLRAHVTDCGLCAEELHLTRAIRLAVRSLPVVEPPPLVVRDLLARTRAVVDDRGEQTGSGTVEPIGGRRVRIRPVVGSAAAMVAVAVLGLSVLDVGSYRPAVDAAVERHAASLQAMVAVGRANADGGADPLRPPQPIVPTTAPSRNPTDLSAPYAAPERLDGGYRLVEAFSDPAHPDVLQLVYVRGRYGLSVFQSPGDLDFEALPAQGRRLDVGGADGWRWESPEVDGRVVVYERNGLVVTVVGDEPGDAVLDAARSMPPPPPPSVGQRARQLGAEVLEALTP